MDDWVKSINKMIKGTKAGGMFLVHINAGYTCYVLPWPTEMILTYSTAYQTAVKSIEYLDAHVAEDRALIAASAPFSLVNRWLEYVDKGQVRLFCSLFLICTLLSH